MTASGAAERAPRVLTFGETMGLCGSAGFGAFAHAAAATVSFGGAESNVAIGLSRLGVDTTWVSRLGDDLVGRMIARGLRGEGVDVRAAVDPVRPTGFMLKERTTASNTTVLFYRSGSAASAMTQSDLPLDSIADWDLLHVTGIFPALGPSTAEAALVAMRVARDAGVRVSFDVNHRTRLWSQADAARFLDEALPLCDIVFAGDDEARIIAPKVFDAAELASVILGRGAGEAVIKLGADGAYAATAHGGLRCAAVPVGHVVDSVGAGDAFVAGYLAEALSDAAMGVRLDTAVRCGAIVCETPGDWEGAPTRAQLARVGDPVQR